MYFGVYLVIAALIISILFLYYIGFFNSLHIKDGHIGPFLLLYKDYRGNLNKIDSLLSKFEEDLKKYFHPIKAIKIYYDNPIAVLNKSQTRAIYGIVIDEKENFERISKFCKRFEDIRFKSLPRITGIYVKLKNQRTHKINNTIFENKILPKLVVALGDKAEKEKNVFSFVGLMEIQDRKGIEVKKSTKYAIPYGNETNEYLLTIYPDPEYSIKNNKNDY